MSKPVIITAESSCDLSTDLKRRYSIRTIPLTITLDNVTSPSARSCPLPISRRCLPPGI